MVQESIIIAALRYNKQGVVEDLEWMHITSTQGKAISKVYEDILTKADEHEDSNSSVINMNYIRDGDNFIINAEFKDYIMNYDCRWTKGGQTTC